ncbi:MAG: hypothetical protein KJ626_16655 [Verrucomicrobia bacterium]|nr:hypothetical protein [Verrucomicrobiota bacterium]
MRKRDLLLDTLALVGTIVIAVALKWEARDLIWGLWISSLTFGYLFIITTIVVGVLCEKDTLKRISSAFGGLFLIAFFSVHFCMFHFVHAMFLNSFFPIIDHEGADLADIPLIIHASLGSYWPMVLATFISRLDRISPARLRETAGSQWSNRKSFESGLAEPYINVVRMHILIFIFAGLHAANLSHYAIYPVIAFYFVPWGGIIARFKNRAANGSKGAQNTPL